MQHRIRQRGLLNFIHSVQEDGHQERGGLIVGDVAGGHASHKEFDLFTRQFVAVPLLANDVLWTHL